MECKGSQKLPLVVSSKPFYIQRNFRVPPSACCSSCNYKPVHTQDPCHKHDHDRNLLKLNELRWYIEHSVDKDKCLRADRLKRKKEEDDLELQRKRQWVLAHKLRHQEIIEQMKMYLEWCRKVHWVNNPCDCGCLEGILDKKGNYCNVNPVSGKTPSHYTQKTDLDSATINTVIGCKIYNKGFQYSPSGLQSNFDNSLNFQQPRRPLLDRLNRNQIALALDGTHSKGLRSGFRFNRGLLPAQKRTEMNSFTLNKSSRLSLPKLKSLNASISSKPTSLIQELSEEYFQKLVSLEKDVKIHLASNQTVQSMLNQLANSNKTGTNASLDIISLTKKGWEAMFKSVVTLKRLEDDLARVSLADNLAIVYDEESELRKQLLDDLYYQLTKNQQYFKHTEIQLQFEEQEQKRVQCQEQQPSQRGEGPDQRDGSGSALGLCSQNVSREQVRNQREREEETLLSPQSNYQLLVIPPSTEECTQLLMSHKRSQIQERLEGVINQRVHKKSTLDLSKPVKKKSVMDSNKSINRQSVLAEFNVEQLIKTKSGQSTFSMALPLKEKSNRTTLKKFSTFKTPLATSISRQSLVKARKKPPKPQQEAPVVVQSIKVQSPPPQPQDLNEPLVVQQLVRKNPYPRFDNSNFINRIFEDSFKWPQQESTLNNHEHQSVFADKDLSEYQTLKALKAKRKVLVRSQGQGYLLQRINKGADKYAIRRRFHQLFTEDYYMLFTSEAQQYRAATQKAECNQDLVAKIGRNGYGQDDFGWVDLLNLQPSVHEVDLIDLLSSQKIKQPVWKKRIPCMDDQVEFTKELVVSPFQKQTHHNRVRAFRIQSNFITHKQVNNGQRVFFQQTM